MRLWRGRIVPPPALAARALTTRLGGGSVIALGSLEEPSGEMAPVAQQEGTERAREEGALRRRRLTHSGLILLHRECRLALGDARGEEEAPRWISLVKEREKGAGDREGEMEGGMWQTQMGSVDMWQQMALV